MTLTEAIDRNKELRAELIREGRLEKADSVGLSIEALKRLVGLRSLYGGWANDKLPGETED